MIFYALSVGGVSLWSSHMIHDIYAMSFYNFFMLTACTFNHLLYLLAVVVLNMNLMVIGRVMQLALKLVIHTRGI
jgi:hypothetical protein